MQKGGFRPALVAPVLWAFFLTPLFCTQDHQPTPRGESGAEAHIQTRRKLGDLLHGNLPLDQAKIEVACWKESEFRSAKVFGRGIGIWNRSGQFSLTSDQVRHLLKMIHDSDFATEQSESVEVGGPRTPFAIKVLCDLTLSISGSNYGEKQLDREKEKPKLTALANMILDFCEQPAQSSIRAASLGEGLDQIRKGRLAPETLSLLFHRKPPLGVSGGSREGVLLQLAGRELQVQSFVPGEGYSSPLVRRLNHAEVLELVSYLIETRAHEFPPNLYSTDYTDLTVSVLNWERKVQAQRFSGMTRDTHGDRQVQFERLVEFLKALSALQ